MTPSSPPLGGSASPVSLDEVQKFLQNDGVKTPPAAPPPQNSAVEINADVVTRVRASDTAPEMPEPQVPLQDAFKPKPDPWSMVDPDNKDIVATVTPPERDEFVRAMLHGKPMTWLVEMMESNLSVEIEVPPIWLQQFIERYFEKEESQLSASASRARLMHRYMVVLCLSRVRSARHGEDTVLEVPDFGFRKGRDDAARTANNAAIAKLLEFYEDTLNPVLFSALLTACRIADMKWTICVRKQAGRNFWHPAGTV